jgi:hypothetical protein
MRTSGHSNEGALIVFVIVLAVVVATILAGGPSTAMETLNELGRGVIDTVSGWL